MPSLTCIDDTTLRAYLLGDLPERLSDWVTAHLENCPRCEAAARRLDGLTDPLLDSLRAVFCPPGVRAAADEVLTVPNQADTLAPAGVPAERPQQLGQYALLDEIGRGGMSVVYRAQQMHP
jgi:anti-sigma factor RsiW